MTLTRSSTVVLLICAVVLVAFLVVRAEEGDPAGSAPKSSLSGSSLEPRGSVPVDLAATDGEPRAQALDPGLIAAYDQARVAAADAGHDLVINSGYRTPERQQELLDEEIAKRGSFEAASRWVFTPDRSMHVQGLAIDVGDEHAADWLTDQGARFGLCHTLSWEWWHFEWRQRWQDAGSCPPEAQDPSEAPGR